MLRVGNREGEGEGLDSDVLAVQASAELVAVSSIITYDVYKRYFNPHATDKQILWMSHIGVVGFGVFMGILGVIFHEIGISLSWLYGFTGTFASAGVFPVGLAVQSRRANKYGCLAGLWIGFICGITAWLATAKGFGGLVNVATTGGVYEQLAANAGSFFVAAMADECVSARGLLYQASQLSPHSLILRSDSGRQPEDADAEGRVRKAADDDEMVSDEKVPEDAVENRLRSDFIHVENDASNEVLYKDFILSVWLTVGIFVVLCIIVPALMVIPRIWSQAGFTFYIVLAFIWTFSAAFIVVIYPVVGARSKLREAHILLVGIAKGAFEYGAEDSRRCYWMTCVCICSLYMAFGKRHEGIFR
ncbi:hypothetical protein C8F01DRAFT_774330 [Mycena amicta]|nr:hypothetical protein C8F01DRAFT_774330 [Mycena amicta]